MDGTRLLHPRVLDAALLGAIAVGGLAAMIAAGEAGDASVGAAPPGVAAVLGTLALPVPLWWRRRAPVAATFGVLGVVVGAAAVAPPGVWELSTAAAVMAAVVAIGSWGAAPKRAVGTVVLLAALLLAAGVGDGHGPAAATAFALGLIGLPAVAGYAARIRRRYVEEVERQLARAERERDERAQQAIIEERTRLARELHDVVAHHVSLIGVQAGAARISLDRAPERTREALAAIEESSRQAVGELQQLLSVLRPVHDGPTIAPPAPGVDRVAALVAQWQRAGLAVRGEGDLAAVLAATGPHGVIGPALSTTCYRVVEEALTNAAKHSLARAVTVRVALEHGGLSLLVHDEGPARPPVVAPVGGTGRGLLGMAERVALFDGVLRAGPCGAGFTVEACFPLTGTPSPYTPVEPVIGRVSGRAVAR
ncbi:MAG: hypothetical protein IT196_23170 [Acidimicrobiales bacterium]|nr:hypothetical protein [Acidimicrobiales bacterium]